jgi:hypothetical protein
MPKFEPFWNAGIEPWPGRLRRKQDVIYDTHIGAWCDWNDLGGLGIVATDEFRFSEDGGFVWLSFVADVNGKDAMVRREGNWQLAGDVLALQITFSEDPVDTPRHRADLRIFDRTGRLGLKLIRSDDEVREDIRSYFLLPAREGDSVRVLQAALEKKQRPQGALPTPYSSLKTLLKMAIPAAVKKLKLPEPAFCMRIYYFDTHAPREDYGFSVRVLTEPVRQRLAQENPVPANLADELWLPQAGVANGQDLHELDLAGNRELTRLFGEVYELLAESEDDDHMPHLRELARRTSKALNARNWSSLIPVTDDFVIFPADGSGYFDGFDYEDDLQASVPAERIELLRQRGYLS